MKVLWICFFVIFATACVSDKVARRGDPILTGDPCGDPAYAEAFSNACKGYKPTQQATTSAPWDIPHTKKPTKKKVVGNAGMHQTEEGVVEGNPVFIWQQTQRQSYSNGYKGPRFGETNLKPEAIVTKGATPPVFTFENAFALTQQGKKVYDQVNEGDHYFLICRKKPERLHESRMKNYLSQQGTSYMISAYGKVTTKKTAITNGTEIHQKGSIHARWLSMPKYVNKGDIHCVLMHMGL